MVLNLDKCHLGFDDELQYHFVYGNETLENINPLNASVALI